MNKKMGRPTDNPKIKSIRIRLANDEIDMLNFCTEHLQTTKSDIVREGIKAVYEKIVIGEENSEK